MLCLSLNVEKFAKKSMEVMLKLLGTYLGRNAMYTMCSILQDKSMEQNAVLLRGAVFYISMSLWGSRKVDNLDITFSSVLPSIKQAVLSNHTIVVFEVTLSLRRLIRTYPHILHPVEWDCIYDIMAAIQDHLRLLASKRKGEGKGPQPPGNLGQCLRDLFVDVEDLLASGVCSVGEQEKFFDLVEENMDTMPLKSVLNLVSYRTSVIDASEFGLVEKVVKFMDKFYVRDRRPSVRIEALNYMAKTVGDKSIYYESELMENVVLQFLQDVASDTDSDVRCRAAEVLVQLLAHCSSDWCTQLLALLNSILQKGLQDAAKVMKDKLLEKPILRDSRAAVFGLTDTFKNKLHSSSPMAAQILSLLVVLLQQHYDEGHYFPTACGIRMRIFKCIMSLRSNEFGQVGCSSSDGSTKFSPFFVCRQSSGCVDHSPIITPMLLDYRTTFSAVMACLEKEIEFDVLSQVLDQLRQLLQDRSLTLSSMPDLSPLCLLLCSLTDEKSPRLQKMRSTSNPRSKLDTSALVYPVLTVLTTYPGHLDRAAQHALVCCLESGLIGKSAHTCVSSLSLCSLELQATMTHLLSHVLLKLGQVAATPTLALPVLEFLSGLIPIPNLYSGFVDREYLSVFAIALPYTDNQRYPNYVIAMAHRVIAQWFVRCRLHYRPTVASFICKKLSVNLEGVGLNRLMGYQASPSRLRKEGGLGVELAEVCMDMMARYTHSTLSTMPSRTPGSDFLVAGGPSKTWIVGNCLVTITTSGRLGIGGGGACKRCAVDDKINDTGLDSADETCWHTGWAEIRIRRSSGNTGWMMRLQNRPHPLSMMHPSSHGIPESELGLLAASVSPYGGKVAGEEKISAVRKESTEEEIFLSREVGSFTDISFLYKAPSSITTKMQIPVISQEEESEDAVSEPYQMEEPTIKDDLSAFRSNEVPQSSRKGSEDNVDAVDKKSGSEIESKTTTKPEECGEQESGATISTKDTPGMLDIRDTTSLLQDHSPEEDEDPCQKETAEPNRFVSETTSREVTPPIKRSSNSHSWSATEGVTSPLPISPRASSFTISMEYLPPLLSYDGGEEPSHSPSLHTGGKFMSEEEQLTLYASMSDLQCRSGDSEENSDTEKGSSSESDGSDSEGKGSVGEEGEEKAVREEDSATALQGIIASTLNQPPLESQQDQKPVSDTTTTSATQKTPQLKYKSASLPEEEPPIVPTSSNSLAPPTYDAATPSGAHSSPLPHRRKSVPPVTPPGNSPSVARKRLVYNQRPLSAASSAAESVTRKDDESASDPSFIFLQLYSSRFLGDISDTPILLPANETTERAIKVLDHIPPYETHKVGVVYVDKGQTTELQILSNTFGSSRYLEFLHGLGPLVCLKDIPPDMVYLGGLDRSGTDGEYAFCYHDDITQVIFHVATKMPTDLVVDPSCSNKKLHIGNDFVTIIYNDSGLEYKFGTIKGQFNYVEVLIEPLHEGMNCVQVHAKKGLESMLETSQVFISDTFLPILVRQKALQANLASKAHASSTGLDCNLTNWLGRFYQINKMREKYCRREEPGHTPGNTPGNRTPKTPHSLNHMDMSGASSASILSDFTNYS